MTKQTPPRAPLAFRVGIVGHRPNRLESANLGTLRAVIKTVLTEIRTSVTEFHSRNPALYASGPILRAITPLAEGTDRLFAQAALDLHYSLCCPMPFPQAEYERDFMPPSALEEGSLEHFRTILTNARTGPGLVTYEIDGERSDPGGAYGAAGRVVLNQSDLLVVVWDGEKPEGRGGTVDTLREAVGYRVPVVWIDAVAPHSWCILGENPDLRCLEGRGRCVPKSGEIPDTPRLRQVVQDTLELPASDVGAHRTYFSNSKPRFNFAIAWKLFRGHMGENRFQLQSPRVRDFEKAIESGWPTEGGSVGSWVNGQIRAHYAWADKLADLNADHHRSAIVLAYPLAALSVLFALIAGLFTIPHHQQLFEIILVLLELATIVWIFYLIRGGRRRHWHDRWLDYRLLAEFIRQLRILIPLGGGRPFPRQPSHLETYGSPSQTWMSWHTRAIARAVGLPDIRVDGVYVRECLAYLRGVVEEQRTFHLVNSYRSKLIEHRLHLSAVALLILTVGAMVFHLGHLFFGGGIATHEVRSIVTLCCAFFPALGAALAGLGNQGEFTRLEKRSRAMAERLKRISEELGRLADSAGDIRMKEVTPRALDVAQLMVDEVLDWRVVFIDRPPKMPV